jgi:hypothetical protein
MLDLFTNFQDIYQDCNAFEGRDLLWVMYHKRRYRIKDLKHNFHWNTVKNIVLIDQEGMINNVVRRDKRIHLWDSTISDHPRSHTYLFWFDWVRTINSHTQLTSKLLLNDKKNAVLLFDALTGTSKSNKIFVNDKIDQHIDRRLFLIGTRGSNNQMLRSDWKPGGSYENGSNILTYNGNSTANSSCFVPYEIYNQTWYSIVTESQYRKTIFFSEKTAKPLISKRLFVMFSSQNFLSSLRSLGFQTFGDVIDESYDCISDDIQRWTEAWRQVEYLMTQDPKLIYQKINEITEHNYQLISSTDHYKKMCKEIHELLTTSK